MSTDDHPSPEFEQATGKRRRRGQLHRLMFIGENTSTTDGQDLIGQLPDECVRIIFSFISSSRDRCTCAAVSKKWLLLLANMRGSHFKSTTVKIVGGEGSRCLEAKEANDARVAAMAVGTYAGKLLGKLSLRGGGGGSDVPSFSDLGGGITDFGLNIISQSFPKLKSLALWDCHKVTSSGLASIAASCPALESLDISNSPRIDDDGLVAIGKNCVNLSSVHIESCPLVGNSALESFGNWATKLESLSIIRCPLVGDVGVISAVSRLPKLVKVRFGGLNVGDSVLQAIVGKQSDKHPRNLCLENTNRFTMAGFTWIESAKEFDVLTVRSCQGLDVLRSDGQIMRNPKPNTTSALRDLKHVDMKNCVYLTDSVLARLTESTHQLQTLKLESCNSITTVGFLIVLKNYRSTLKVVSLTKCNSVGLLKHEYHQEDIEDASQNSYPLLDSLTLKRCGKIRDELLSILAPTCAQIRHISLVGLTSITDRGITSLLRRMSPSSSSTVRVSLSGCTRISDWTVRSLARTFGSRLMSMSLEGCLGLTDRSLEVIAELCDGLVELDVSGCGITDSGLKTLVLAEHQKLEVLSLAGCSGITDESLDVLEIRCVGLVGLNLRNCGAITRSAVESVRTTLWWCDLLH